MAVDAARTESLDVFPELVCPADALPLANDGSRIVCGGGHSFSVARGIPRILLSGTGYVDAFGEQWNRYRLTQLDSYTGTSISGDRLQRCLGGEIWNDLSNGNAVQVLETGCGAGRFTEVLLSLPGAFVTSVDLSSAVDANQQNCPESHRHRILQCDIHALPFRPSSYDVVLCLGVIQHTPNPEQTIASLYRQVKPGGWLVIDHYTRSLSHSTKIAALMLRPVLKRLSPRNGRKATDFLTRVFFPLHRMARRHRSLLAVVSRISPLLTYYHAYPQLRDEIQYEWALLDTHDHLTDYYKHFRTSSQIAKTLSSLEAQEISVWRGGNGIEARCRKPPA